MLKISGENVQNLVTCNLCTLDTKLTQIMFHTHTKSEMYTAFWAPRTIKPHATAHIVVVLNWPSQFFKPKKKK